MRRRIVNEPHALLVSRDPREFVVEPADVRAFDAVRRQQFELFAQRREPRRRLIRRKKLPRVRLEGHHARGHPAAFRRTAQLGQHGEVAKVDAVEIANGKGYRDLRGSGDTTTDQHATVKLKSLNCSVFWQSRSSRARSLAGFGSTNR